MAEPEATGSNQMADASNQMNGTNTTEDSGEKEPIQSSEDAEVEISSPLSAPASAPEPQGADKSISEPTPKCEGKIDIQEPPIDSQKSSEEVSSKPLEDRVSKEAPSDTKAEREAIKEEAKESMDEVPSQGITESKQEEKQTVLMDPNLGRVVELTKVLPTGQMVPLPGEVVAFREQEGRFPPRYSVQWRSSTEEDAVIVEDDWKIHDLDTPILSGYLQSALNHVQERFQQHVELELETNPLVSKLLLYAAMEEALQTNLQIQQQQKQEGETSKLMGSRQDPHPPLYYTTNPSSYLKAPTATDTTPTVVEAKVHMTPASLAQRVRQGCQWAHRYLMAQQPAPPPPPVPLIAATSQRRSLRQPKPAPPPSVPNPTPVQQGGRVAMWWLEQLEQRAKGNEELNEDSEKGANEEAMQNVRDETELPLKKDPAATPKSSKQDSSTKDKADSMNAVEDNDDDDDDDEESNKQDDDDDYGSKDADLEDAGDHELEDVEKERKGNLSPVRDEPMEVDENEQVMEEEDAEEGQSEEDIQQAVLYENPYLKPNFVSLLEYLARPKALTGEDVQKAMQEIILRIKFNKRSCNVGLETDSLVTVDQVVLDQETPNYPHGKVVLKCVSDESYSKLQKLDAQAFSRCKFALDVIGGEESTMQTQRKQELIMQEVQFKEQKAWSKWRHRGIHEGYAAWPSWHHAIAEWVSANVSAYDESADATFVASKSESKQEDEALAKSLEETEGGGRRRTARRAAAAASDGLFYGNQSQLTQKQLMDALVRLVQTNQFQTLLKLQKLVADDSTDPVRRCRVALGKLVWKRNKLVRKPVDSDLSDLGLIDTVGKTALLSIPTPLHETEVAKNEAEKKALLRYIQDLHKTELHLRRLITKNLAEIPVAIIATAADERPGSMESMDSADFEDTSSIEWHMSGHDLLKKSIFRPATTNSNPTDMTSCYWYEIQDYSKSIQSDAEDKDEPEAKQRRMRFRAVPIPPPGESWAEQEKILILSEGQVHAGLKAAEMERKHRANTISDGNPFSGASGDKITLIPVDVDEAGEQVSDIHGKIVGYDNVVLEDEEEVEYRILVLPESGDSKEAFWASLDVRVDTASYVCQPVGESTLWYSIEQFDYHQGSAAHQQCEQVLSWLGRQSKAAPFAEPVDPVALNIPAYPQVVKHPMDISTMAEKLESGQYSSVLPGQTRGISPISRMLNGPFRKDIELIFDNAMLFNPPDDWIYQAAAQLKKSALKKIADLSSSADLKVSGVGRFRQKRSVYVDEDSDVDLYEYESDNDDEFDGGGRKSRKRKRSARGGAQKDEFAARAIEHPIRLQNTLRDAANLRGPFANLPINSSASTYSLPPQWSCRLSSGSVKEEPDEEGDSPSKKRAQEIAELLELQRAVEVNESAGLRRSTRAHDNPNSSGAHTSAKSKGGSPIEYYAKDLVGSEKVDMKMLPCTRSEVEVQAEKLHEDYYSRLYQSYSSLIGTSESNEKAFGVYANGSFPPYMGRVIPVSGWDEVSWEIRGPFVVPALRWVLRGLIQSGHLTAIEEMNADFSSGTIMTNDIYYWDANLQPYETLDLRELQRKRRANQVEEEQSEDEVELSEYEKARAERVARNAERLKALGLA